MRMVQKNEKGFTLVELLIVVAIIGILSAVAIPQFAKYKRNAAVASAQAALATCSSELAAAYADNGTSDNWQCIVGEENATLELDTSTGLIDFATGSNGTLTVSKITVTCTFTDNKINCEAP